MTWANKAVCTDKKKRRKNHPWDSGLDTPLIYLSGSFRFRSPPLKFSKTRVTGKRGPVTTELGRKTRGTTGRILAAPRGRGTQKHGGEAGQQSHKKIKRKLARQNGLLKMIRARGQGRNQLITAARGHIFTADAPADRSHPKLIFIRVTFSTPTPAENHQPYA